MDIGRNTSTEGMMNRKLIMTHDRSKLRQEHKRKKGSKRRAGGSKERQEEGGLERLSNYPIYIVMNSQTTSSIPFPLLPFSRFAVLLGILSIAMPHIALCRGELECLFFIIAGVLRWGIIVATCVTTTWLE